MLLGKIQQYGRCAADMLVDSKAHGSIALLLLFLVISCMPAQASSFSSDKMAACEAIHRDDGKLLSQDHLIRGMQLPVKLSLIDAGIMEDKPAVDFKLADAQGEEFFLSGLLSERPVVLILGSFT